MRQKYKEWDYLISASQDDRGEVQEYRISFYKQYDDWFDEIRYDSHERKGGKKKKSPHFHMKIKASFKEVIKGTEEIKEIIDNHLPLLKEVVER